MKILFLTHRAWPKIGGVEKHVHIVGNSLQKMGHRVKVISEENIKYPDTRFIGLLKIWLWFFKNRQLFKESDMIHCHDVFIWYLPFRFLYPNKKVVTTFHGWEGKWPIPIKNIIYKRIASLLSHKTIAIGKYIGKYYGIKASKIMYGGTYKVNSLALKKMNKVVFVGRLDNDTGIKPFLNDLDNYPYRDVTFVGDGPLRKMCSKYGKVVGFTDPKPYLKKAEYVVPGGYLSYIDAISYKCKVITYPDNPLKEDYWNEIKKIKKFPTWEKVANEYLALYNSIK